MLSRVERSDLKNGWRYIRDARHALRSAGGGTPFDIVMLTFVRWGLVDFFNDEQGDAYVLSEDGLDIRLLQAADWDASVAELP